MQYSGVLQVRKYPNGFDQTGIPKGTGRRQPQQSGLRNPVFELLIPALDYIYGLIQRGRKGLHPNRPHLTILTREFMCIALLSSLSCPDRVEKTEATGNLEVKVGT